MNSGFDPVPWEVPIARTNRLIPHQWRMFFEQFTRLRSLIEDTHANRLASHSASQARLGTWFYETDRTVWYQCRLVSGAKAWVYVTGTMRGTLSPDEKPGDLTSTTDVGFLFYSTDYAHTYRWNGSAWRYAVELGDPGSGVIEWWTVAPNNNGAYQLCDGTATTRSLNTGGTSGVTVPNLIGVYPKGAAAYTGSVVPAIAPGLTGSTAAAGDHTHGAGTLTAGATANTAGSNIAAGATPLDIAAHTHAVSGTTDAPGDHTHGVGTLVVDDTGEPAHLELLPYYRL